MMQSINNNQRSILFSDLYQKPPRNGIYKSSDSMGYGVRIVKMNELFSKKFIDSTLLTLDRIFLTEKERDNLLLDEGDLLFSRTSVVDSGVGKCSYVKNVQNDLTFDSNMIRIRIDTQKALPLFYFYYFNSLEGRANVLKLSSGAAITTISGTKLSTLMVPFPPIPTQRKIAGILSAYDELIENNTRRIQILEEMARAIYREWFVHYRFPGHEAVKLVDSGTELGMVPEGWEVNPIGEVIEILGGGTPSTQVSDYWENGDINWFCPKDLTASGTMFIGDSPKKITLFGLQKSSARMFPAYSVMMTSRATLGVTSINTSPACTNQGFITCVPNEKLSAYQIYFWIADNLEKIISVASGATFKEITKTTFRKFLVILAPKEINDYFIELMTPLGKQIENLQSKNSNLRVTRDLLLPRLVSGELDVNELEIPTA